MPAPNAQDGLNTAIAAAASAELPDEAAIDSPPTDETPLATLLGGDLPVDAQGELPEEAEAPFEEVPPDVPGDLAALMPEDLPEVVPPEVAPDGPGIAQVADPNVEDLPDQVPEFLEMLFADFDPPELLPDLVLAEDFDDLLPGAALEHGPFALGLPFGLTLDTAPLAVFNSGPLEPFAPFDGGADFGAATVDIGDLLPDLGTTQVELPVVIASDSPIDGAPPSEVAPPGEAPPTVEVVSIVSDAGGTSQPAIETAPVADAGSVPPPIPTIDLGVVSGLTIPDPVETAALVS